MRVRRWQPIEMMPDAVRFDEVVLLFKPDERRSGASRFVGYWDDQANGWVPVYGPYVVENVTHWMPLPAPPHTATPRLMARRLRFRLGRGLMALGLRVLPCGRCRQELTQLLWTWNMRVHATIAADYKRAER